MWVFFSHNLFATYLGGSWTSIIYLGVIQGFHWFSLLPALIWINTALIGILSPNFFYVLREITF